MKINPMQLINSLMSNSGRENLANMMLSKLPPDTREYLIKYKNNPMKGIEEGVRNGKITEKEIKQLRPIFEKARMFGIRLPIDKLDEIEKLTKNKSSDRFSIF